MRFACLGSGSEGNALLVEAGGTRLLVDCGFGIRETIARLGRLGVAPESISAIVVTHEHSDHIGGVAAFAGRFGTPVWLTFGTLSAVAERFAALPRVCGFDSHDAFAVGDIEVRPFPVPHDAREPVQFVVTDGQVAPWLIDRDPAFRQRMSKPACPVATLVPECNHDRDMLSNGDYPIRSSSAYRVSSVIWTMTLPRDWLSRLDNSRLKHLFAAHLSQHNNKRELASAALARRSIAP